MKIALPQGRFVIVDNDIAQRVLIKRRRRCYVVVQCGTSRVFVADGESKPRILANWILDTDPGIRVRYRNGDPMDCRRVNLTIGPVIQRLGDRAIVRLTRGLVSSIDLNMVDRLETLGARWQSAPRRETFYAVTDIGNPRRRVYMHRWILDAPDMMYVDHIDGNGLNNRRENLRLATAKQNSENRTVPTRTATGYRGVREVGPGSFQAYVNTGNRQISGGCWRTPEEAAAARDLEVIRIGSRARLNFETPPFSAEILETTRHDRPKPKSGHPGIRFKAGAWEAWTRRNGKRIYLGRFPTVEAALVAQKGPPLGLSFAAILDDLFGA